MRIRLLFRFRSVDRRDFFCAFTFTALLFPSFFFVFDEGRELEERRKKRSLQIISLSSQHAVQAHVVEHQVAHVDPAAVKRAPRVIVIVVSGTEGGRRGGPRRRLPEQQALPGRREREPERASASSSAAALPRLRFPLPLAPPAPLVDTVEDDDNGLLALSSSRS
jgi:hypothetical protein